MIFFFWFFCPVLVSPGDVCEVDDEQQFRKEYDRPEVALQIGDGDDGAAEDDDESSEKEP